MATPEDNQLIPTPGEKLPQAAAIITGGGITKTEPAREDEPYAITEDFKLKTTGEMAQKDIEAQKQPESFDVFVERLRRDEISSVGTGNVEVLQNMAKLLDSPTLPEAKKQEIQERLNFGYKIYSQQQMQSSVDVPFGRQTAEGLYEFAPTEEALEDPALLSVQENIYQGKQRVAKVVRGTFDNLNLSYEDQERVENILVRNISNGSFWDTLVERVNEGFIRGTVLGLPELATYSTSALISAAEMAGTYLGSKVGAADYRGFSQQWNDPSQIQMRAKTNKFFKEVAADALGVKQLSRVMNEMIVMDLQRQLDAGEISQDDFDRLTTQTITTPAGDELTVKNQFVTEDIAQTLLNQSIDNLSNNEQYGLALADAALMTVGMGKAKAATGGRELENLRKKIDSIIAKGGERAGEIKEMTLFEAARHLNANEKGFKVNLGNIEYALGLETASNNIKILLRDRDAVEDNMRAYVAAGKDVKASRYKELVAEKNLISNRIFQTTIRGRYFPNVIQGTREAIPMSAAMYYAGESGLVDMFEGDRLAAEAVGGLAYIIAGKPLVFGASKSAYWVNQQLGDFTGTISEGLGSVLNVMTFGMADIKSYLRTNDIKQFEKVVGRTFTASEKKALGYISRIASNLDESGRNTFLDSMQATNDRIERIVNNFPEIERANIRKDLQVTFAQMSGNSWIAAANSLNSVTASARSSEYLETLTKSVQLDNIAAGNQLALRRMLDKFKENIAGRTDLSDPREAERFAETLEMAIEANDRALSDRRSGLVAVLNDYKKNIIEDAYEDLPENFIEDINRLETRLKLQVTPDIDAAAQLRKSFDETNEALANRLENISAMRKNTTRHTRAASRAMEAVIMSHFAEVKALARQDFIKLDKLAAVTDTKIDITKMVDELIAYAPAADKDLQKFFGKNSAFFSGPLGKRAYLAMNNIAKRSLESLEGSSYDELYSLVTNPNAEKGYYIGTETPSPLEVALFLSKKEGVSIFKATPGEVMDVYASFRDYAVRIGDDALAQRYTSYSDAVENVVKEQAPEILDQWKQARQTYKAQWFDRFREDGPLTKLKKSERGTEKEISKLDAEGQIAFDKLEVGEEVPEGAMAFVMHRHSWGNVDPSNFLNPVTDNINKALTGDNKALVATNGYIQKLSQEFGTIEGGNVFFDETTKTGAAKLEAIRGAMTEMVYSKWGKDVLKQLGPKASMDPKAIRNGGYNFEKIQNFDEVREALAVPVRVAGPDGKPIIVKQYLIDIGKMADDERDIVKLVETNEGVAKNLKKYSERIVSGVNQIQQSGSADIQIRDEGVRLIQRFMGSNDPLSFYRTYVKNGSVKSMRGLRQSVLARSKDTVTIQGETIPTEQALDRGMTYLIVNGMLENAGSVPQAGRKIKGFDGEEVVSQTMYNPENIVSDLESENIQKILSEFLDEDHITYLDDISQYVSEQMAFSGKAAAAMERGLSPMTANNLISRAFNLARGMVSPTYVAAEFGVHLAAQAGIDLMKLAAGNKEAAGLMLRMMKYPKTMTKADIETFDNLVSGFLITEFSTMTTDVPLYFSAPAQDNEEKQGATQ